MHLALPTARKLSDYVPGASHEENAEDNSLLAGHVLEKEAEVSACLLCTLRRRLNVAK